MDSCSVIGIDLGTTNTCAGVYTDGQIKMIENEYSNILTPSVVMFGEDGVEVGLKAKQKYETHIENTVNNIKRLMGKEYESEECQKIIKQLTYQVENAGGYPSVKVTVNEKQKHFTPEQTSSFILRSIKENAEKYLNTQITGAVISVPHYFNNSQLRATKDAAKLAGLKVLELIHEPVAACLAFYSQNTPVNKRTVLIYDMGGGTLDVSLAVVTGTKIDIKSTSGKTALGGVDFDNALRDYLIEEIDRENFVNVNDICEELEGNTFDLKDKSKLIELSKRRIIRRIDTVCEEAKIKLSTEPEAEIDIVLGKYGIDYKTTINRKQFEAVIQDLLEKAMLPIQDAIKEAKMSKEQIDEIIMVGGSTKIPILRSMIRDFFNKEINTSLDPMEAVGYGAALHAAHVLGIKTKACLDIICVDDIVSSSIGVKSYGGAMVKFFRRNTKRSSIRKKIFTTVADYQKSALVRIYQGERLIADENYYLDSFLYTIKTPLLKGEPLIEVTFAFDESGTLTVSANEKGQNGSSPNVRLYGALELMSRLEVDKIIRNEINHQEEDAHMIRVIESKIKAENCLYKIYKMMRNPDYIENFQRMSQITDSEMMIDEYYNTKNLSGMNELARSLEQIFIELK